MSPFCLKKLFFKQSQTPVYNTVARLEPKLKYAFDCPFILLTLHLNHMNQQQEQAEFRYSTTQTPDSKRNDSNESIQTPVTESKPLLTWQASEFVDHQKSIGWYVPMIGVALVLTGLTYWSTKDILASLVVVAAAVAFGVYAKQKPRTLAYSLSDTTVSIGDKHYRYDDFKSFSVVQNGALYSILLEPVKRFIPTLTIYFPPDEGEKIFDTLASQLPHVERQVDPLERLMQKIRF